MEGSRRPRGAPARCAPLGASAMYALPAPQHAGRGRARGPHAPSRPAQIHYNLLYREDEREMIPVCRQFGMALTPYSPLASRAPVAVPPGTSASKRSTTDATMRNKYDAAEAQDMPIVARAWPSSPSATAFPMSRGRARLARGRAAWRRRSWAAPKPERVGRRGLQRSTWTLTAGRGRLPRGAPTPRTSSWARRRAPARSPFAGTTNPNATH